MLIEDVPGGGKTSLVSALAKSLNAPFKRIQFTPDVLPSDITGYCVYNQKTGDLILPRYYYEPNYPCRRDQPLTFPKTQSSLLEVMEEYQVTVDGVTYQVPQPFMVLATQNPVEYLGTYPLPEAQIDRFFMKISIGYPTNSEESHILSKFQFSSPLEDLQPVAQSEDIMSLQKEVKSIYVDKTLNNYIVDIVSQTRKHPEIALGSSPRGSLSLFRASQAWALYNGRNYVLPDDIKKMVIPVLSHRLILKQEAKLKKICTEDILRAIVGRINVPVVSQYEKK